MKSCLMQNEALPALSSGEAVSPRALSMGDRCFYLAFAGNSAHTKDSYHIFLFQVRRKCVSPGSKKHALWRGRLGQENSSGKTKKQCLVKPEWSKTMSDLRRGGHHQSNMMFKGPEVIKRKKR